MNISFVYAPTRADRWKFLVDKDCVDYFNNDQQGREMRGCTDILKMNNVDELINHIFQSPLFAELVFTQYTGMFSNTVHIHDNDTAKWAEFIKLQSSVFGARETLDSSPQTSKFFITHMNCTNFYIHVW